MKLQALVSLLVLGASTLYAQKSPVEYVNTLIGTHDSRPMQFPGAAMPFGMVKLGPDNQKSNWKAGHEYLIKNIAGFNCIHDYQMTGFYMMPICGAVQTEPGDEDKPDDGYRSRINNDTEVAIPGYYSVMLEDYGIKAEISSTTRTGVQRYTFPKSDSSIILYDLQIPYESDDEVVGAKITKVSDNEIEGYLQMKGGQIMGNTIWLVNDYVLYFVSRFDKKMENMGAWQDDQVKENITSWTGQGNVGGFVRFKTEEGEQITSLTAISTVSQEQARLNLDTETKEMGFDFDKYTKHAADVWNELLGKIKVEGKDEIDKIKFYTNLYRAYSTRTIWSDVNGKWMDMNEEVQQARDGMPVYGCDAFWGMKWNLNGLWSLLTPKTMNSWVNSLLEFHKIGGWLPKGPTAGEYTAIMTSAPAVSLIAAAYQQGMRDYDIELAYEAIRKVMMEQGVIHKSGGFAGNRWQQAYMDYGYVPSEQGPASATFELSFQDWCVAQMAKDLGKTEDYNYFMQRSLSYRNHFDSQEKYARIKSTGGDWVGKFNAFSSDGFIEGNGWQYTFHVPHNVQDVINFVGADEFLHRLDWGFTESAKSKFNATGDNYAKYPINHGNQPNMQAAFLFNYAGAPWMTQRWTRAIQDVYYGATPMHGWLGDEDEGQMGAWYVLSSLGLFQMQGGCSTEPIFDLTSPLFEKSTVTLENGKTLTVTAKNNSKENIYIQSAKLNGKPLNKAWIYVADIQNGGSIEYVMGPKPNKAWGTEQLPPSMSPVGAWAEVDNELAIHTTNLENEREHKFMDEAHVSMSSKKAGAIIRYTLDGSPVNASSPLYTEPFKVTKTTEISAGVFNDKGELLSHKRMVKLSKIDYELNMLTNQKVTASVNNGGNPAAAAVDGKVDLSKMWDASPFPQWWQVELAEEKEISQIHLFTYWDNWRSYTYNVEVSTDGTNWIQVVDASNNKERATEKGYRHSFAPTKAKYIRVNMLSNTANHGVHLVEVRAY